MKNATIATSRTRATTENLIDYRPLSAAWGDVEALHAVRAARTEAAANGHDASTVEIAAVSETSRPARDHSRRERTSSRRERGAHRRPARGLRRLVLA
ncbi:hypothetical protein [Brachybacterium fresconis]|uniref:Uncharacterized protein n=1 Tax=Brachybacterium fresconis TaxID=173363 RepID=A0ABS4YKJ7_9MICO|nr:hypothetical protein [Brachybacterium fresconis]MBP2409323.1 hypothetical protein [Brachybacterium fresconis]